MKKYPLKDQNTQPNSTVRHLSVGKEGNKCDSGESCEEATLLVAV